MSHRERLIQELYEDGYDVPDLPSALTVVDLRAPLEYAGIPYRWEMTGNYAHGENEYPGPELWCEPFGCAVIGALNVHVIVESSRMGSTPKEELLAGLMRQAALLTEEERAALVTLQRLSADNYGLHDFIWRAGFWRGEPPAVDAEEWAAARQRVKDEDAAEGDPGIDSSDMRF